MRAAAAATGGVPRTEVPIPEVMFSKLGGVGSSGAVWVMGCWEAMLATAIAGAARESATVSSGISSEEKREREIRVALSGLQIVSCDAR